VTADPLFNNYGSGDYTLQPLSPARNAGVNLGYDLNGSDSGNFYGALPDLGCYEYYE
jgi:hypothetical protein